MTRISLHTCITALLCALAVSACTTTQGPLSTTAAPINTARQSTTATPSPAARAETSMEAPEHNGPQIVFAPNSAELPSTATPVIEQVAARLKADPWSKVVLIGHTEDMGSSALSVAVASKCAQKVSQALIRHGARPSQIRTIAQGHDKRMRRCSGNNCPKQTRRVDIVLSQSQY